MDNSGEIINIQEPLGWDLVWYDEFNGNNLDTTKWNNPPPGDTGCSPRNNEQEIYSPDEVYLDGNSNLVIRSRRRSLGGCEFTSGAIVSKFAQAYGRFEIRAKLPVGGQGLWPALWLVPSDTWPPEIDIVEAVNDMSTIWMVYHWGTESNHQSDGSSYSGLSSPSTAFHIFALEWEPGAIRWYIDDVLRKTHTGSDVTNIPMQIYLNTALGGDWPGSVGSSTSFPQYFLIDYVRIYKKATQGGTLDVSSVPLGAKIFIDGVDQAKVTRSVIQNIPAGSHSLRLTLSGYLDYTTTFTITGGQTTTLNPTLTPVSPTTGTLDISSVPLGAKIFIDGADQAKVTRSVIQGIQVGSHSLRLTLSGYLDYTTIFTITGGHTTTLNLTLTPVSPTTGTLDVSSVPLGAKIFIDGADQSKVTRSVIQNIPAGSHSLRLTLSGYLDYTTTFTITGGLTTILNLTLTPVSTTTCGTIQLGSRGNAVFVLQVRLQQLGYYTGLLDGIFGSYLDYSVRAYQTSKGITADGIVRSNTWISLGVTSCSLSTCPIIQIGNSGNAVLTLQTKLKQLGYYSGPLDSVYGIYTIHAIILYKIANRLAVDDVVNAYTWTSLGIMTCI